MPNNIFIGIALVRLRKQQALYEEFLPNTEKVSMHQLIFYRFSIQYFRLNRPVFSIQYGDTPGVTNSGY